MPLTREDVHHTTYTLAPYTRVKISASYMLGIYIRTLKLLWSISEKSSHHHIGECKGERATTSKARSSSRHKFTVPFSHII